MMYCVVCVVLLIVYVDCCVCYVCYVLRLLFYSGLVWSCSLRSEHLCQTTKTGPPAPPPAAAAGLGSAGKQS